LVTSTDAILDAWYPGMRGGAAMADAVVGAFSPSGRSPVTWYSSDAALPADRGEMSPYATATSPGLTYRFYNPSVVSAAPPVFTFGEGYSYTSFAASQPLYPTTISACAPLPLAVMKPLFGPPSPIAGEAASAGGTPLPGAVSAQKPSGSPTSASSASGKAQRWL
jgi:hypothetical protein